MCGEANKNTCECVNYSKVAKTGKGRVFVVRTVSRRDKGLPQSDSSAFFALHLSPSLCLSLSRFLSVRKKVNDQAAARELQLDKLSKSS